MVNTRYCINCTHCKKLYTTKALEPKLYRTLIERYGCVLGDEILVFDKRRVGCTQFVTNTVTTNGESMATKKKVAPTAKKSAAKKSASKSGSKKKC